MRVKIQKWGNSLAARIPKPFAQEADVQEGAVVDLTFEDGKLVATPTAPGRDSLMQLLRRVTKRNLHGEVDLGGVVGRESW